jgi:CRP/FNR family transcriptional regulator, cyclic AMP receptor protein
VRRRVSFEDQLAQVPLFAGLSRDDLHRVSRLAVRTQEGTGTHLVREGERGDELLVILDGTVDVRHGHDVLATLHTGDHLGEVALLDPRARRTASVVATTPVTVAYLGRHEFELMVRESVGFVLALLATMARRITDQQIG